MGCCYSFFCNEESPSQNGEVNERTHLLEDPVCNTSNFQRVNSEDLLSGNFNTVPKKTDEQSALNRILQETATNVIDVAALESHTLPQNEVIERTKQYNIRLQAVCANNKIKYKRMACFLQDVPDPIPILASEPIPQADLNLINTLFQKATAAIKDIKVEHKEDLVVPFYIP